jgi:hypothetical protein
MRNDANNAKSTIACDCPASNRAWSAKMTSPKNHSVRANTPIWMKYHMGGPYHDLTRPSWSAMIDFVKIFPHTNGGLSYETYRFY